MTRPTSLLFLLSVVACVDEENADTIVVAEGATEPSYFDRDLTAPDFAEERLDGEPPGPVAALSVEIDRDQDNIANTIDTCPDIPDATNLDVDGDGLGNACDADYDGTGFVTASDFGAFTGAWNTQRGDRAYDSRTDHDGNGSVTALDYAVVLREFGKPTPPLEGVVPFASAAPGDLLTLVTRYPSPRGPQVASRAITAVTRTPSGSIETIDTGFWRIRVLGERVWMIENIGLATNASGSLSVLCPRAVVFPDRPINGLSQLCSPLAIEGISISISRS